MQYDNRSKYKMANCCNNGSFVIVVDLGKISNENITKITIEHNTFTKRIFLLSLFVHI